MSRFTSRFAVIAALACGLGLHPPGLGAEEPPLFVERVEVNVVNVEVVVTDAQGRHVTDLGREDFEVFEDGQKVEITNFYAVADEAAAGEPAVAPIAAEPATVPKAAAGQRLNLLIYVDNYNLRKGHREQVLEGLRGFLEERAGGGDRVMVVVYDRGLEVALPFTSDPERIAQTLEGLRKTPTGGEAASTRLNIAMRQIAHALSDPMTADQAPEMFRSYRAQARNELLHSTSALGRAVRALAGLEGRKTLLYVSDGLTQRPGEEIAERFFGGQGLTADESTLFRAVVREANANRVTFYALDARGKSFGSISAERDDSVGGGSGRSAADAIAEMNLQQPLLGMSDPTGGVAFLNSANVDGIVEQLNRDFDRYYSLGFEPRTPGDGRFHRIEVKPRRPGLSVRHRAGFLDKPDVERMADQTLSTLLTGAGENPLGVTLEFAEPTKEGRKAYRLPILIKVPLAEVALLPRGGVAEGRLRIYLVVQDADGALSEVHQFPYPLEVDEAQLEEARGHAAGHRTELQIGEGEQRIAVGVLDEGSGARSFVQDVVVVGKAKKKRGR